MDAARKEEQEAIDKVVAAHAANVVK